MAETPQAPRGLERFFSAFKRQRPPESPNTPAQETKRQVGEVAPKVEDLPFDESSFLQVTAVREELAHVDDESRAGLHGQVPEITPDMLPFRSGFATDEVAREIFEKYIAEGFRRGGEIHARYMNDDDTTMLEQRLVKEGWQEVAKELNRGQLPFHRGLAYADAAVLTLKLIAEEDPDFMLYGGGYGDVVVFYPGRLAPALEEANPENNPYKNKDQYPARIAMIRASDVAALYDEGIVDIKPEKGETTFADTVVVSARDLSSKPALMERMQLFSPPSTPQATEALLHAFQAKSIQSSTL